MNQWHWNLIWANSLILDEKRSTLATGAVQSENLPYRLHDVPGPKPRREIERVPAINNNTEAETKRARHSSLASVVGNLKRMALGHWKFEEHETLIRLSSYDNEHVLPKFQVTIYSSLKFRINIFGWSLIISHPLYTQNEQSVKFLSLRYLLDTLDSFIFTRSARCNQ